MSLVELIARADERGLAAAGLACSDRCVTLLGGDDETLRPLWGNLMEDSDTARWGELVEQVRSKLEGAADGDAGQEPAVVEAVALARRMLDAAPDRRTGAELREWADTCSVAALRIHRLLDPAPDPEDVDTRRAGRTEGMPPLAAAELRRQVTVLELLAEHGPQGLRRALEVSTEGRRVLRAAVSRRARTA
ncbi:hypothetical protein OG481_17930 [Streptomyces longwoodensis]|uniref:hypothetical protein n=1 Tax=Streptomyces longwoodensis TaxID=68231 RepID=UPI002DDC4D10|nr:hypothetical protein [Streptomyces longwoodensis]WRY90267.1 hypothetical protein OG481_17930 [Streptomyces longwoodensis]